MNGWNNALSAKIMNLEDILGKIEKSAPKSGEKYDFESIYDELNLIQDHIEEQQKQIDFMDSLNDVAVQELKKVCFIYDDSLHI